MAPRVGRDRRPVVRGAVALVVAGLGAKALSAVSRVLLARWLGAEVIGLYELSAAVLAATLSLCAMGLPVATAALVGRAMGRGDRDLAQRLLASTRRLLWCSGTAGAAAVFMLAPEIARVCGNPAAALPLRAMAPAVLFAVWLAGEKAWLQGSGRVAASAAVVALEQFARVAAALGGAVGFVRAGSQSFPAREATPAATAVAWSPAVGAVSGLVASAVADRVSNGPPPDGVRPSTATNSSRGGAGARSRSVPTVVPLTLPNALPESLRVPLPVEQGREDGDGGDGGALRAGRYAAARALLSGGFPNWTSGLVAAVASATDAALITRLLMASGLGTYVATARLGELNGMAMPLAVGPTVIFGAISTALVPAAAGAWARGRPEEMRRRGQTAYYWVMAAAAPAALGLWQMAQPLCLVLYRNTAGAASLGVLSPIGALLGLAYVAGALANAAGRPAALVPGAVAGALAKTALVWTLVPSGLGITGAAAGMLTGSAVSAAWGLRAVRRMTGCSPPWRRWATACLPALACQYLASQAAWTAVGHLAPPLRLAAAGCGGGAAYLAAFAVAHRLVGRGFGRRRSGPWG